MRRLAAFILTLGAGAAGAATLDGQQIGVDRVFYTSGTVVRSDTVTVSSAVELFEEPLTSIDLSGNRIDFFRQQSTNVTFLTEPGGDFNECFGT